MASTRLLRRRFEIGQRIALTDIGVFGRIVAAWPVQMGTEVELLPDGQAETASRIIRRFYLGEVVIGRSSD